jgi:hypothetical protein
MQSQRRALVGAAPACRIGRYALKLKSYAEANLQARERVGCFREENLLGSAVPGLRELD